jgi:hypothetical protein
LADNPSAILATLESWLNDRLSSEASAWFTEKRVSLQEDRDFYLTFALAPRKLGKADLQPTESESQEAEASCPGWDASGWTVDQAARIALLLSGPEEAFVRRLNKLCATGDIGEQVTLYQALPLYPNPDSLANRAAEGLRSNVVPVYQAVAHGNPFPRLYFEEAAWNQMVLKALFIGSRLHPILGLDERANEPLASTMIDYAHERWAAHRDVSPELWRCVGPFLNESRIPDIKRAWASEGLMSREAAGLSLAGSDHPEAKTILETDAKIKDGIDSGEISWSLIYQTLSS